MAKNNNPITGTKLDRLIGFQKKSGHKKSIRWAQEKELISLLAYIVDKGFTFYDVGANRGFYPIYIQHLTGGDCDITAFEPYEAVHSELEDVMTRYPDGEMRFIPNGLWSKHTKLPFYLRDAVPRNNKRSLEASSFMSHPKENAFQIKQLEVFPLDDFPKNKQIDFLKIDTEGCEEYVLEGARDSLKYNRITSLYIEVYFVYGINLRKIIETLREFGYHVVNKSGAEQIISKNKIHIYASLNENVIKHIQDFDLHQYYVTLNG